MATAQRAAHLRQASNRDVYYVCTVLPGPARQIYDGALPHSVCLHNLGTITWQTRHLQLSAYYGHARGHAQQPLEHGSSQCKPSCSPKCHNARSRCTPPPAPCLVILMRIKGPSGAPAHPLACSTRLLPATLRAPAGKIHRLKLTQANCTNSTPGLPPVDLLAF